MQAIDLMRSCKHEERSLRDAYPNGGAFLNSQLDLWQQVARAKLMPSGRTPITRKSLSRPNHPAGLRPRPSNSRNARKGVRSRVAPTAPEDDKPTNPREERRMTITITALTNDKARLIVKKAVISNSKPDAEAIADIWGKRGIRGDC